MRKNRPFDAALYARYCDLLSDGVTTFAAAKVLKVPRVTLHAWTDAAPPALADTYARARERQAEAHADRIEWIAEATIRGEIDPQAARVAIDAKKWAAAKLRPKVYGDRIDIALEHRSELLVLDYSRSASLIPKRTEPAGDVIDVVAIPAQTGDARIAQPAKRKPKRERVASMSKARRAKYEANRTKMEAARAELRARERPAKGGGGKKRAR